MRVTRISPGALGCILLVLLLFIVQGVLGCTLYSNKNIKGVGMDAYRSSNVFTSEFKKNAGCV